MSSNFKKYKLIFQNGFQKEITYRFDMLAYLFSELVSFAVIFYLWSSIYRQGGQIGNYQFNDLIIYYFISNFIMLTIKGADVGWIVGDDIRLGQISTSLLRPISYSKLSFFAILGKTTYKIILFGLVFCVIGLFLNQYIEFDLTFFQGIIFLVSLILGYLIRYLIFYMVGLTTFWFGFVWGFNFTMNVIIGILDGSEIPVDLLPNFIIQINNWLPFKYIVYVPISIFNGRMIWSWELVVVPLVWIVVLYIATKIIFKKGVKAYEAYGA